MKEYLNPDEGPTGHCVMPGVPSMKGVFSARGTAKEGPIVRPCQWRVTAVDGISFRTSTRTLSPTHTWKEIDLFVISVALTV